MTKHAENYGLIEAQFAYLDLDIQVHSDCYRQTGKFIDTACINSTFLLARLLAFTTPFVFVKLLYYSFYKFSKNSLSCTLFKP